MTGKGRIYLGLAVVGFIVPTVLLVKFVNKYGFDVPLVFDQATGSLAAGAVLADVVISSVVFWVFMAQEGARTGITWWPYVIVNLLLGLCVALPLFLYQREARATTPAAASP